MKKYKNNIFQSDELFHLTFRRHKYKKEKRKKSKIKIYVFFFFIIIFIISSSVCYYLLYKRKQNSQSDKNSIKTSKNLIESYIKTQKDFCENPNKYINQNYEDNIFLSDINFKGTKFQMYIFKTHNFLLDQIKKYGAFEISESSYIIEALKFYSSKFNILNNKDIYMLDIGGNIGWYPSLLGRYGYNILNNKDIYMLDIGGNIGWYPSLLGRYGYIMLLIKIIAF